MSFYTNLLITNNYIKMSYHTMENIMNTYGRMIERENSISALKGIEETLDEIQQVKHEVHQVKGLISDISPFPRKAVFTSKSLSEYLHVSTRTLQNWRDEGAISFTQVKDVILYSIEDVEAFLKKHKRVAFK